MVITTHTTNHPGEPALGGCVVNRETQTGILSSDIGPTAIQLIRRSHGHMRQVIALLLLICQAAAGQSIVAEPARTVQVRSYVRKDGTVVAAYT